MVYEIAQGSNGVILNFTIKDNGQVVDLTGATVQMLLTLRSSGKIKQAEITDVVNGKCTVTLNADDILFDGVYTFQNTVSYPDGRTFTSNVQKLTVTKKIGFIPVTGGGSGGNSGNTEVINGINGHILVNGNDVKVYDDSSIKSDINSLNLTQHSHSNKAALDRLGIDVENKLTIDGVEIVSGTSYDDTTLKNNISTLQNSDAVKRLGISANGKLTIDGVEVTIDDPASPVDGGTFTTTFNTNIVDGGGF